MRDIKTDPWLQTVSGRVISILHPYPDDIEIGDIAHALSNICRFGGHTTSFFSVAQHSIIVSHLLPPKLGLWGLLHDASEAYLTDIPRPLKIHLNGRYAELEKLFMDVICEKFGLPTEEPPEVNEADQVALVTERRDLLVEQSVEWDIKARPIGSGYKISPMEPWFAKHRFLGEFSLIQTGDI
jgi:hypothetical protein